MNDVVEKNVCALSYMHDHAAQHNALTRTAHCGLRLNKPKESRRGRATQGRLIESARALFVESGVNGFGLEQIARHAGVTRGAVYWHFSDKTDLFLAMIRELGWRLRDLLDLATVTVVDGDPLQRLETELLWLARAVEADPVLRDGVAIVHSRGLYVGELAPVASHVRRGVALFRLRIERADQRQACALFGQTGAGDAFCIAPDSGGAA